MPVERQHRLNPSERLKSHQSLRNLNLELHRRQRRNRLRLLKSLIQQAVDLNLLSIGSLKPRPWQETWHSNGVFLSAKSRVPDPEAESPRRMWRNSNHL